MLHALRERLYRELDAIRLIDPHTHIDPKSAASKSLADILGYHYYTELAHSAGVSRAEIEDPQLSSRQRSELLMRHLGPIDNTAQYAWFLEMSQELFGFTDESIHERNWEQLYDLAQAKFDREDWESEVLERSQLDAVFLTNDFDDPLTGFDTRRYIPCLRTDELVFHLMRSSVRERLHQSSGVEVKDSTTLRQAIGELFQHFSRAGAKACAISLPPTFCPRPVSKEDAAAAVDMVYRFGEESVPESKKELLECFVFWTLAEYCAEFSMAFDLMIGVNRNVYPDGVHQGRDLYDSRVSLYQYRHLFNRFSTVKFPVSVLASVTNQELVSYAWIFPNVITHGHWWYSNTPSYIRRDLASRLEAVPRTKQIGYYSDMYKLEFALPKFRMFKRILAQTLAEDFVVERGWSEERAVQLGWQVLRGNVETTFGMI